MENESLAGETLKLFCKEFGVPEILMPDGSKEQTKKGTQSMKTVKNDETSHKVIGPDARNHKPAEGDVGETRKKWHRSMIRKMVPKEL